MQILAGIHKNRKLIVPSVGVRPTLARLKQTIFDILQDEVLHAEILDLFAGSGGLGLEALSRGAARVTFVEKSPLAASVIRKNIAHLNEGEHTTLLVGDLFDYLPRLEKQGRRYHLIFADPPYSQGLAQQIITFLDSSSLLVDGGSFMVEDRLIKGEKLNLNLTTLTLISERKVGKALLLHFRKRSNA